jgi:hypothetical protein
MSCKFIKKIESFTCNKCGHFVAGNGYTNHCPNCLWSKHVDINPGDRLEKCKGMMKPVSCENLSGRIIIVHKCVSCGTIRKNKAAKNDKINENIKEFYPEVT